MLEISDVVRNFEQKIGTGDVRVNTSDRLDFPAFSVA
jgi:hypothetical protein